MDSTVLRRSLSLSALIRNKDLLGDVSIMTRRWINNSDCEVESFFKGCPYF